MYCKTKMKVKDQLKDLCKNENNVEQIKSKLLKLYEQITDQPKEKGYSEKYDLVHIANNFPIKILFEQSIIDGNRIIFEIVEYKMAPKGYILVMNVFRKNNQIEFIMYV